MNKKVLSAILFSALFAGTGTFTSCIDNDEPAGIEELRGAKAELLRAKVAVEQAQASLLMAQAEVEKAKAAKQMADAEISKALAAINQAKADSINVKTEQEREKLKQLIAENELALDTLRLHHQKVMASLKEQLVLNNYAYEQALAKVAVLKELFPLGKAETWNLMKMETEVKNAKSAVRVADSIVQVRQAAYDSALVAYEYMDPIETGLLEAQADTAEIAVARAKAKLAKFEGWLEEDVATKDWRAEVDELVAEVDSLNKVQALLNTQLTLALNSDEKKALDQALAAACVPAYTDSAYSYTYLGVNSTTGATENTTFRLYGYGADTTTVLDANIVMNNGDSLLAKVDQATLDKIAKYNQTTGKLENSRVYLDKQTLASFTAEVRHFLDTIAAQKAEADTIYEYNANLAIKAWSDTLAMYKNADATVDTKWTAAQTALNNIAAADQGKAASYATFRTKLIEYYTAAIANGATLNQVPVQVKGSGIGTDKNGNDSTYVTTVTSLVDMMTALNDATNGNANVMFLVNNGFTFNDSTTVAGDTIDYKKADGKDGELAFYPAAFNKLPMDKGEMYAALVRASDHAFGKANLYHQTGKYEGQHAATTPYNEKAFLHVKPDSIDVLNIAFFNNYGDNDIHQAVTGATSGKLGEYGKYLIAKNDAVKAYANNYEAIIANLEGAITYWEATYKTLKTQYEAWVATKKDAKKAVSDFLKANNTTAVSEKSTEIGIEIGRLGNIISALRTAIQTYMPDGMKFNDYGTENFITSIEGIIKQQQLNVRVAEKALADAKIALELDNTTSTIKVELYKMKLDAAIADLEERQAELDKALAELAKALEIIAALEAE